MHSAFESCTHPPVAHSLSFPPDFRLIRVALRESAACAHHRLERGAIFTKRLTIMLSTVIPAAVGKEDSTIGCCKPMCSSDSEIQIELSTLKKMNEEEPSGMDAHKPLEQRSRDDMVLDGTKGPVTNPLPPLKVEISMAARSTIPKTPSPSSRRSKVASTTSSVKKRSRRCSMSDAQRPSPPWPLGARRMSWRDENKENIDPCLLLLTEVSPAQPPRRKRLLSESSSTDASRQLGQVPGGGNNLKSNRRKSLGSFSREPLRVLWTREGNGGAPPPVFLRSLREVR